MADFFGETDDNEVDPNKDYLAELVGEGKKFKDERELARAKAEADAHIRRIEAENQAFREKLQQAKSVEELMDQLKIQQPIQRQDPPNHGGENVPGNAGTSVSAEDLDKLITEKLTAKQQADQAKANQNWVLAQLQQRFGSEYGKRVQQVAADLGLSKEDMSALASEKPKAFMKLVDDNQPQQPQRGFSPPDTRVNTQAGNQPSGVRNYAFYQALKKSDPKLYQSARVQTEMHREAIKQGAAFFD